MQTNNFPIHEIPEVVNINILLFLIMASCLSSDGFQCSGNTLFVHHLLTKMKAVQSKALKLTYRTAWSQHPQDHGMHLIY
jgi:hypothetical protein